MSRLRILALTLATLLGSCASTQPPLNQSSSSSTKAIYTSQKDLDLHFCALLTVNAMHTAKRKLGGDSIERVLDDHAAEAPPHGEVKQAMVRHVYEASFSDPWDFATTFFNDCALHGRGIAKDLIPMAAECAWKLRIGSMAHVFGRLGVPPEKTWKILPAGSERARDVVLEAYRTQKDSHDFTDEVWRSCMPPVASESPAGRP